MTDNGRDYAAVKTDNASAARFHEIFPPRITILLVCCKKKLPASTSDRKIILIFRVPGRSRPYFFPRMEIHGRARDTHIESRAAAHNGFSALLEGRERASERRVVEMQVCLLGVDLKVSYFRQLQANGE